LVSKYKTKLNLVSALSGDSVNEMFNGIIESAHSKQEKKKKKFDDFNQHEPISSSQNIHRDELNSNRSNNSQI